MGGVGAAVSDDVVEQLAPFGWRQVDVEVEVAEVGFGDAFDCGALEAFECDSEGFIARP